MKSCLYVLALMACFGAVTFGQETTGAIEGILTDAQGARLAGASVRIEGANFNRTVTADDAGFYRVLQVPPGRYAVTASARNLTPAKRENLEVVLGKSAVASFTLEIGGITTEVVVVESLGTAVDTSSSRIQTNIPDHQIALTPKGTQFSSVLKVAPGVLLEPLNGGFQVDGSSGAENTYTVDGLEVTNFRTGQLNGTANVPFEFVREVQIKSGGFEAEYGGATGGVINVVTQSGGNDFHGTAGIQIEDDVLNSRTRPTLRSSSTSLQYIVPSKQGTHSFLNPPDDTFSNKFPHVSLGGPILKDRLWFYSSYVPQFFDTTRERIFADGSTQFFRSEVRREYLFTRLDAAITDTLRVSGTYTYNPLRQIGQLAAFDLPASPGSFEKRGGRTPANNFTYGGVWTASPRLVINARGGRDYLNERGSSYGIPNATRIRCVNAGNAGLAGVTPGGRCDSGSDNIGNNSAINKDISKRNTFDASASIVGNKFGGRHLLQFGYQLNKVSNDVDLGFFNTGRIDYFFGQSQRGIGRGPGELGVGTLTRFGTVGEAGSKNQALFVQDSWQPFSRLTLNLGFRIEKEEVPTFSANGEEIQFDWDEKPAPRLAGAYDLFGNGKTKILGSFGWFYDRFKFELPRGSFGGDQFLRTFFPITNPNIDALTAADILRGNFLTLDFRVPSNDPADNRIDPDLDAARETNYTVGVEHELVPSLVVSARYTHKEIDRAIEDVGFFDDIGNENFFIANPGRGVVAQPFASGIPASPKAKRDYDAFEIRADRRFANNYYFTASYTYSQLDGNYSGLASSDEDGRSSPNVNRFFDLPFLGFNTNGQPDNGRLATDRPHVFKAFSGYSFNWFNKVKGHSTDLTLGYNAQSGTPLSTRISVFNADTFLFRRGDRGRTEDFSQTDVGIIHHFRFGDERYGLAVEANVLNLFNQNNVLSTFNRITPTDLSGAGFTNCGSCDELEAIRAIFNPGLQSQIVRRLGPGGDLQRDARFDNPSRFQSQREIRLGVKVIF